MRSDDARRYQDELKEIENKDGSYIKGFWEDNYLTGKTFYLFILFKTTL